MNVNDIFYISVYCENNCSFDLIASLLSEIEIQTDIVYAAYLMNDNEKIYKYSHSDDSIYSLEIDAFSSTMNDFKMYVTIGIITFP